MDKARRESIAVMGLQKLKSELEWVNREMEKSPRDPRPDEVFPRLTARYQELTEEQTAIEDRIDMLVSGVAFEE